MSFERTYTSPSLFFFRSSSPFPTPRLYPFAARLAAATAAPTSSATATTSATTAAGAADAAAARRGAAASAAAAPPARLPRRSSAARGAPRRGGRRGRDGGLSLPGRLACPPPLEPRGADDASAPLPATTSCTRSVHVPPAGSPRTPPPPCTSAAATSPPPGRATLRRPRAARRSGW